MKKDLFDKIMDTHIMKPLNPFYMKHKESIMYLFFGGLSFVLNIILFYLFIHILNIDAIISNTIAWIIIVAFCFITNKIWVFDDNNKKHSSILQQVILFYISRLFTLFIENMILYIGINHIHMNETIIKIIAQIIVIVMNYIISKLIIFRKK